MKLLACALVLLVACSSCTSSGGDRETLMIAGSGNLPSAMRGVDTLSFHPTDRRIEAFASSSETDLRGSLESALVGAFRRAGYRVSSSGGQRVISYALGVTGSVRDEELAAEFGISPGLDLNSSDGRAGLLLVLTDARTGVPLWRGSGSAVIGHKPLPLDERNRRIAEALEILLVDLPQR